MARHSPRTFTIPERFADETYESEAETDGESLFGDDPDEDYSSEEECADANENGDLNGFVVADNVVEYDTDVENEISDAESVSDDDDEVVVVVNRRPLKRLRRIAPVDYE